MSPLFKKRVISKPSTFYSDNQVFLKKLQNENNFFLNSWLETRYSKNIKERYSKLKSFILWLNDAKNLCHKKGIHFENWFKDCIADDKYIQERTLELQELNNNFRIYEKEENKYVLASKNIDERLMIFFKLNQGILQKDVYTHFDSSIVEDIKTKIYFWSKNGIIKREKSGNSYKIFTR